MDVCSWATYALYLEVTVRRREGGVGGGGRWGLASRQQQMVWLRGLDPPTPRAAAAAATPQQTYNFNLPGQTRDPLVQIGHFVNSECAAAGAPTVPQPAPAHSARLPLCVQSCGLTRPSWVAATLRAAARWTMWCGEPWASSTAAMPSRHSCCAPPSACSCHALVTDPAPPLRSWYGPGFYASGGSEAGTVQYASNVRRTDCQSATGDDWCSACDGATCQRCFERPAYGQPMGQYKIELDPATNKVGWRVACTERAWGSRLCCDGGCASSPAVPACLPPPLLPHSAPAPAPRVSRSRTARAAPSTTSAWLARLAGAWTRRGGA